MRERIWDRNNRKTRRLECLAVVLDKDGNKVIDPPKLIQVEGDKIILAEDQDNLTYAIAALEGINGLKLAEWVPCELIANFTVTLPNEKMVVQFLKEVVAKKKLTVRCDIDWINLLLLDLNITNGYNESLPSTYSSDFISSFVATTSGLNQECLYQKVEDGVCQVRDSTESFTLNHPNTLAEDYFQRALNDAVKKNPEDIAFVYSAPLKGKDEINLVVNDTLVTAYSALKFTDKVVAVAGVQMSLSSVLKVFNDVTSMSNPDCEFKEEKNDPKQCEHTCDTPGISCVLMDSDGYILACKDETEIGSHIAKAEPILFENILSKGFFYRLSYIDHQGLCMINTTYHPASGWSLLNPLSQMKNLMMGLTERFILILMTFNWYEWLSVLAMPTVVPPEDTTRPTENINITTRDEEYRRCDLDYSYYKLNNSLLSNAYDVGIVSPAYCPEDCKNSYSMFSVPNTNLVLLVLASRGCDTCDPLPKLYVPEATEFGYNTSEELRCDSLWKPRLRLAPDSCSLSTNVSKSLVTAPENCSLSTNVSKSMVQHQRIAHYLPMLANHCKDVLRPDLSEDILRPDLSEDILRLNLVRISSDLTSVRIFSDCTNSYSMFSVPNTNLVLLVLASTGCDTCNPLPKLYVPEATEFGYNTSEELRCDSLWKPRLRLAQTVAHYLPMLANQWKLIVHRLSFGHLGYF
ncbi:putative voltage-dependent calcium channel subunit alpha-2/delta-3 isoform X1 [Apostichopus japonicus]|uniref:Putative voltage-dependent calcium channel subunit alpha-2/delta-3 isoform X1 n=1 Tax=Stichopus japonicus TaxID=307972 RepID=A0A2G8JVJ5_STIJA|nr:putative voltage-dependent calcium channel subunit alpha-2/delta-3 isoform X1 [Apostichopus japonicus]